MKMRNAVSSRKCREIALRITNSLIGISGCALLLYSVWMVGVCLLDMNDPQRVIQFPWFVMGCLASGLSLCLISCIGHAAAFSSESTAASDLCMSCYVVLLFMLLTAETFAAAVYLNRGLTKEFPEDPTGKFDEGLDLIQSHINIFKWLILLVAIAQALSFLLAVAMTTATENDMAIERDYESLPAVCVRSLVRPPHGSLPYHVLAYHDEPRFVSNKWVEY